MILFTDSGPTRKQSRELGDSNTTLAQIEELSQQVRSDPPVNDKLLVLLLKIMEMKLTIEGLEKERDFYFGKLRDIEVGSVYSSGSESEIDVLLWSDRGAGDGRRRSHPGQGDPGHSLRHRGGVCGARGGYRRILIFLS